MADKKTHDEPAEVSSTPTDVVVEGRPIGDVTPAADGDRDIDQPGGKLGVEGDPNVSALTVDPDATNDPPELYSPTQGGPDRFGPGPHEDELPAEVGEFNPASDKA